MTTINNIADLARILKEQPEWAATLRGLLLTEELLNLPAQFAEFVQETRESNRLANARLTQLETQFAEFVQETRESNRLANERQTQLEELTRIINERLIHVEEYTRSLNERMNRLEGRFSNYEGIQYEHGVRNKALFRAQRRFKLEEPYLAMVQDAQSAPALNRVISQAINNRTVTDEECEELQNADIIISDANNRHALFEVSITADDTDIERAKSRADILRMITQGEVIPAVITAILNESQRWQAATEDVAVFIIPYP